MSVVDEQTDKPEVNYQLVQASPEFQALRSTLRRFVFPVTLAFLAWYMLYVVLSGYARGFMSHKLIGNINVAFVFGLTQFVSTFAIAAWYERHASENLDPRADALRAEIEDGQW